jgi:hypothetical protein
MLRFALLQHMLRYVDEGIEVDGFGDVFDVFAVEEKLVEFGAGSAENDNGNFGKIGVLAEGLEGAPAIHARHINVQYDETWQVVISLEPVEQIEAFDAVGGMQQAIFTINLAKCFLQQLQVVLVIVHV